MKMLPMKFYFQRARILAALLVICMAVYIIARVFFDIQP